MWIRSQNKTVLIRAGFIDVCDTRIFASNSQTKIEKTGICIGKYETVERAIEVLDEIQESVWDCLNVNENVMAKIYEMPER